MSSLASATFVILLVFISVFDGGIFGFNLDSRIPVIKKGPPRSHFGYSVAQHKTNIPGAPLSASKRYESWMLVGAPKGQNLQPGTERSGALFKCPLTTLTDDCEQVQTDGLRGADGKILPPSEDEEKNDQWMGVTVKSQGKGGDILVCGHRYQHKGLGESNFQWGYGLCYRLNETFGYEDNYQPCVGKPVSDSGYQQFGYCQAGTSGLILDDEVLLGIPGTYTWRGTIYTSNISGNYLWRDQTPYFGVYTDDDSPVQSHSYLGYSVTSGRFFEDHVSYIAGAPKAGGTGQVVFFRREKLGIPIMPYDLIINGEAFASSFGYEVVAMDLNGDGWDDLVVSAPFYFTKSTSGAVYVFLNEGGRLTNETPYTRLEGAPDESRFGHSMSSLGDINLDGYNDLAVGAPYEGRGVIYIYLGSRDGIIKEAAQVIRAEDLPGLPYDAFGYSLSGGLDMDGNGYNDLLTSSFCSDRVVLLRARPIIKIQTKVEPVEELLIDPVQKGCPEDPHSTDTCFSFNACFKMKNEAGRETYLQMRYNISERVYKDNPVSRVRFHRADVNSPSTVEQIMQLKSKDMAEYQCSREVVYLQHGIRDVLRPIRFKLSYEIYQREPKPVEEGRPLPDIDDYPILNQQEAVRYFEANFAQDCGSDEICESDLILNADLDLEPHKGASGTYYILELGRRQYFTLTTNVTNDMEPAYRPNLYVSHDPAIDLSLRESETGSYQCSTIERGLVHCQLDNPLINQTETFQLVFKPSGLPFTSRYVYLDVWVNTTSAEKFPNDNSLRFTLEVKRRAEISIIGSGTPEQVWYSGDVVGESALETIEEIGAEVEHKYIVDNRGPWRVEELKVEILWPHQVENNREEGKWLLYMTEIPYVDGDGECDVDPRYVNPLSLGRNQGIAGNEVSIGNREKYTGVTDSPTETSTKITKVTKKVTSISEKKTYKKTSHSKSKEESSSSSGSSYSSENTQHGSRSHSSSSTDERDWGRSRSRGRNEYDNYDDSNYDHYDDFFNKKKAGTDYVERRPTENHRGGYSRGGSDYDRSLRKEKNYDYSSGNALNAVHDFKKVQEENRTFINGYDRDNRLVWSSRNLEPHSSGSRHYSSHQYSSSSSGGGSSGGHFESDSINEVVDFRIIREGENSWVNGYDKDGELVWSSRRSLESDGSGSGGTREYRRRTHTVNRYSSSGGRDEDPHRESSFSEYEYRGRSQNGQHEGDHRLTESDRHGERTRKWKSSNNRIDSERENYRGNERELFDWSNPDNRDRDRDYQSDNRYNDRSDRRYGSYDRDSSYRSDNYYRPEYQRRNHNENRSRHYPDDRDYEGATYTRAVIDDASKGTNVYTQRIFSRKSGDQWEEVLHPPFSDSEWSRHDGHTLNRVKREQEQIIKPEAITDSQTGKTMQVVNFRCDGSNPTAKCFIFECTIRNLAADQAASIKITSRLWNSTLVEDYSRVSYVSIKSKGMLILPEEIVHDQDQSDDSDYAETLAYSNLLEQLPPEEVPLWIILVAVLAGLLLLILIAVILWKIGFFKRRRPDPTLSGNIDRDVNNGY